MSAKLLLHGAALAHYSLGIWYDLNYVDIPAMRSSRDEFMKGRLRFLTFWDLLLQALFFTICFLNDLVGTNDDTPKKPPVIRKIKDLILPCLAFPLSMFVGLTFWGLYSVDRELIFPKALDPYFPSWLNHLMHTNIMIFILIEMYVSYRKYPSRKLGLSVLSTFMLVYLVWIHVIHAYSGLWVYPILDVLNLPARVVFFVVLLALAVALYLVGEKLNSLIWQNINQKVKSTRKSR